MSVTGALIERGVLNPLLDVRSVNLMAERDCLRMDADLDVLASDLQVLADGGVPLRSFRPLVSDLLEARRVEARIETEVLTEGRGEVRVLSFTDTLVTDLRRFERSGQSGRVGPLSARGIARKLREPLRVMAEPSGYGATWVVRAGRALSDAVGSVPRAQLLAPGVRRELGERAFCLLEEIVNDGSRPKAAPGQPIQGRHREER